MRLCFIKEHYNVFNFHQGLMTPSHIPLYIPPVVVSTGTVVEDAVVSGTEVVTVEPVSDKNQRVRNSPYPLNVLFPYFA